MRIPLFAVLTACLGALSAQALSTNGLMAQGPAPTARPLPAPEPPATVTATRNEPAALAFTPDKLARLKVPAGFALTVMATDLGNARMLHVMPDGGVYLSRRKQGDVWYLKDVNKDGKFDAGERRQVASNLSLVHGMDVRNNKLYVVGEKTIWVMDMASDGTLGAPRVFADGFPDAGQHSGRSLKWGPDGFLYASFGSTNNDVPTPNPEEATMLRIRPDGQWREVYARGLRHTIGFGWHPVSKTLYGFDHGSDWHGDDIPPEELNVIQRGKNYGWPFCYGDRQPDPYVNVGQIPGLITKPEYCARTQGSTLTYTAHAAPIGLTFYTGAAFPAEYRNDAFVAFRGSWNRLKPSGYEIARVNFDANNKPTSITPFITGFVFEEGGQWKQFGRLAGIATYTDGSLLFTDDQSGVIYRVRHTGGN
ncbi:sorbosone dehydrogenase family protein [Deinococcus deserti]|uniref:Putative glucose/sorbosone dehydrogenase n=1 Tax=Deinococcus deserti (strain DSM 17065 / CIP 109153 / LMG 22923 / VCD115) TaxID=546414 RepID=C1D240_DEIDV|nr:sorbosone dehydrogenase family protein [Deinococcus deserti]ACO47479.1 putative glucose/sorbosone dehydrogenase, precursor [Deinococcus deserti VCD115]